MLIVTRRVGEAVMIGDGVAVVVLGIKGQQVRIGVRAPRETSVHRQEVYERIQEERRQAAVQSGETSQLEAAAG